MSRNRRALSVESKRWVAAGAALATAVAAIDVALEDVVLVGMLSVGPLITGLRAGPRATVAVGAFSLLLAVLVAIPDGVFGTLDYVGRVLVVVLAGVVAGRMAVLRLRARQAGVESRNVVHSVFHSALDCIVSIDAKGDIVDLNRAMEETFGYTSEFAIGKPLSDLIVPERLREDHCAGLARMARGEAPRMLGTRIELPAIRADGEEFPIELTITKSGTAPGLYTGFIRDITERRKAEQERDRAARHATFLAQAGVLLESALDYAATLEQIAHFAVPALADWAFVEMLQPDGSIKRAAMAHTDPAKVALVRELDRRYPLNPDAPEGSPKVIRTGRPELMREIPDATLEAVAEDPEHLRILRELGFHSAMIVPLRARGRTLGDLALVAAESGRAYDEADLAMVQDLATRCALAIDNARLYAESRENADKLRHQALHDPLTGLPNRTLFLDRLEVALARASRRQGTPAVLFLDLDGFKAVNDLHGHKAGDDLLAAIPERLHQVLREEDTVARFGGDEFAILCEVFSEEDASAVAHRVIDALERPFEVDGAIVQVGVSLGFASADGVHETPEGILRKADASMYEVKRAGGAYRIYR